MSIKNKKLARGAFEFQNLSLVAVAPFFFFFFFFFCQFSQDLKRLETSRLDS